MYGLPGDFTGSGFLGKELEHITVCSNLLIFCFSDGGAISLESSYSVTRTGELGRSNRFPATEFSPSLRGLLNHRIAEVRPSADGTCAFAFENGMVLWLYDDPRREAYLLDWETGEQRV